MIIPLILGFVLGAAAILFALQNTEIVALTFLGYSFESSLALLVLIALAVGALAAFLIALPSAITERLRFMGLKGENKKLKGEVERLKNENAAVQVEAARSAPPPVPAPVVDVHGVQR